MSMKFWIAPPLALLLLAGCGKKEEAPKPAPPPVVQAPAPAPEPAPPVVAPAAEPPAPSMAATPAPATAEAAKPAYTGTYTVRKRDTLSRIARKLGLKQSDLASWNGITDPNQLRVGQKLKLSATGS